MQTVESPVASRLNENQQRRLLISLQHIDKILSDAERVLASDTGSPFAEHIADASPVQVKIVHDYILRIRKAMTNILRSHDIPLPQPTISSLWAFQTTLTFCEIAAEELRPKYMRGFGDLSEESKRELEGIASELESQLKQIRNYLDRGLGGDLRSRLKRLEGTTDEVRLLGELERIITIHGFVEFRSSLSILIEHFEQKKFEVALFGRVNSGKSSLLNYILGQEILPVGVNPVTAVPVRIEYGEQPGIIVRFVEGKPLQTDLPQLLEYASEQFNPANGKHVTRIKVTVPHPLLRTGVVFVDTPGLGSLATSGEAEAISYLPNCNLGIVLIDAASTLTKEDLSIIRMLCESGADAMVLQSKADLIRMPERLQAKHYVQRNLSATLGIEIPVFAVSVVGEDGGLAQSWLENGLQPTLKENTQMLKASLRRKIGGLREAVVSTLQNRITAEHGALIGENGPWKEVEDLFRKVAAGFTATGRNVEERVRSLLLSPGEILHQSAEKLSDIRWTENTNEKDYRDVFAAILSYATSTPAIELLRKLKEIRETASEALRKADLLFHIPANDDSLPEIWGMPIFDHSSIVSYLLLQRPKFTFLGRAAVRRQVQSQIETQIEPVLTHALHVYRKQLQEWTEGCVSRFQKTFEAKASVYQAHVRSAEGDLDESDPDLKSKLKSDWKLLKEWNIVS